MGQNPYFRGGQNRDSRWGQNQDSRGQNGSRGGQIQKNFGADRAVEKTALRAVKYPCYAPA